MTSDDQDTPAARPPAGVVTGANQRAARGVKEAHRSRVPFETSESFRRHVATHGQIIGPWLQVLSNGQHVNTRLSSRNRGLLESRTRIQSGFASVRAGLISITPCAGKRAVLASPRSRQGPDVNASAFAPTTLGVSRSTIASCVSRRRRRRQRRHVNGDLQRVQYCSRRDDCGPLLIVVEHGNLHPPAQLFLACVTRIHWRGEEFTLSVDSHNTGCPVIKDGSHVENAGTYVTNVIAIKIAR